jgi:hypothetical protein
MTGTAMCRNPHSHQPEDTVDKLDLDSFARIVRGMTKLIEAEINVE